jgi:hypothetical protein
LPSPTPASRPDSDRLNPTPSLNNAHAPSLLTALDPDSPACPKEPLTHGPKVDQSPKVRLFQLSPTPKSPKLVPQNAAHATLVPNLLLQADPRPDIMISSEASPLLNPSNGPNQVTLPLNQLEKPESNPPAKKATPATQAQEHPTVAALPSVLPTEPSHSEHVVAGLLILSLLS